MLNQAKTALFYVIIFFLPFQVGLHFWPQFSYVSGVRIDYLSPTLYFLDLLILAYIFFSFIALRKKIKLSLSSSTVKLLSALFILSLLWNLFNASSIGAHVFGIAKLVEFFLFGYFVSQQFKEKDIKGFINVLGLSAVITSFLAVWQFINQSSVGGVWYYLGERTFGLSTIGISTVNLESQILRPYGAFPHPNVLAFFLLVSIVFISLRIKFEKKLTDRLFLIFSVVLSSVVLLLTFSRITTLLLIFFLFYVIYSNIKSNLFRSGFVVVLALCVIGAVAKVINMDFLLRGIDFRAELFSQAATIFLENPYFGIGLNNFFIHQATLIKTISPIAYQPVHNIFVLSLLSLGAFGFLIVPYVFFRASGSLLKKIRKAKHEAKAFYISVFFVLVSIVVAGMLDHFFFTLEQGQIIISLILGLSFLPKFSKGK